MKKITVILMASVLAASMACTGTNKVTVNHTSGVRIFPSKLHLVGKNHTSMGAVTARRESVGFSVGTHYVVVAFDIEGVAGSAAKLNTNAETLNEMMGQISTEAQQMGANQLVNVSYVYTEVPIFFPFLFGLSVKTLQVSGEAVAAN